ncbi:hypothetical protein ACET3Z_029120 [Daucus carota]
MGDRRWEEMPSDCLVDIFGRLDSQSKLLHIPAVCKTWNQAVDNPLCWQQLDFNDFILCACPNQLMETVVNLSQGCVTSLTLELPGYSGFLSSDDCPSFEGKWKNLEFISLKNSFNIEYLIKHISIYLPSFNGLSIGGGEVDGDTASMIVSLIPKLKHLTINNAFLQKKDLLLILKGCSELLFLDVRNCDGFGEDDEEILKLASAIKTFRCDGSKTYDLADDYDWYPCNDLDLE